MNGNSKSSFKPKLQRIKRTVKTRQHPKERKLYEENYLFKMMMEKEENNEYSYDTFGKENEEYLRIT